MHIIRTAYGPYYQRTFEFQTAPAIAVAEAYSMNIIHMLIWASLEPRPVLGQHEARLKRVDQAEMIKIKKIQREKGILVFRVLVCFSRLVQ